jgi:integrase-like protein
MSASSATLAGFSRPARNRFCGDRRGAALLWLGRRGDALRAVHPIVPLGYRITDNGMVFTTRLSGGRGGRNGLEHQRRRLGVTQKNGKPNHPQTQGKVERLWQTLKKWLAAQPIQPADLAQLQALLNAFTSYYHTARPHRSLPGRATPAAAYAARPTATPGDRAADTHDRVRTDIIGTTGTVTLRTGGKLHHIGIGRAYAGTHIIMLVQDLDIRIIDAATGELLRDLTLDPNRNYQPTRRPTGPTPRTRRQPKHPEP